VTFHDSSGNFMDIINGSLWIDLIEIYGAEIYFFVLDYALKRLNVW